jgi:hypothetical protein
MFFSQVRIGNVILDGNMWLYTASIGICYGIECGRISM